MALTNIEVVSVPVTDQDAAKSFYVDKLGFSVEIDNAFAGGSMRWVMLRPPGAGTAITLVTWFETMAAGSLRGAVLGCDDLEKTLADLAGRGVTFSEDEIQEAPWGRWKTFADPDGNAWVLQQNNPAFHASHA
jgi:catechol 2,3-dioxygenase-like lactoylglutathione lyase family enzyme